MDDLTFSEDELLTSLCKSSLYQFVQTFWSVAVPERPVWNWHIKYLCDEIQTVVERVLRWEKYEYDLVVNVPPGSSKSTVFSIMTLPWVWTRLPSFRVLGTSYSGRLAAHLGRKARDVVQCDLYKRLFPKIKLRDDVDAKFHFENTAGGMRYSVGTNGAITGHHFHLVVIDDPIDPKIAASEAMLEAAAAFISQTLPSRKVDLSIAPTITVMQRLRQGDPTDVVLAEGNARHIRLPATLEYPVNPPELAANYVDGLMDPVRLTRDVLRKAHKRLHDYGFAGQYGQCLVAGTLVSTGRGEVPIEKVAVGDEVWTREGLCRVYWAGKTKDVEEITSVLFSDGSVVSGTPDHPVWTENRGWTLLRSLEPIDCVLSNNPPPVGTHEWAAPVTPTRNVLSSTETSTFFPRVRSISGGGSGRKFLTCIGKYGLTTTALSPRAMTFTTKTKILAITALKIWNVYPNGYTDSDTRTAVRNVASFLRRSLDSASFGTSPLPDESTIGSWVNAVSNKSNGTPPFETTFASLVEKHSNLNASKSEKLNTVPESVKRSAGSGSTVRSASGAGRISSPPRTEIIPVPGLVEPGFGVPVYDLAVERTPEFFANGVLVHNSPIPAGGGMFKTKKLNYGVPPLTFKRVIRVWDKAATKVAAGYKNKGAAFTAGVKMARGTDGRIWILHVDRFQLDSWTRDRRIRKDAVADGYFTFVGFEVEPGSGGKDSYNHTVRQLAGFKVRPFPASGAKEDRADPFSSQVNSGHVWIAGTLDDDWVREYVEEMKHWPFSTYLDQIDASAHGYNFLTRGSMKLGGAF